MSVGRRAWAEIYWTLIHKGMTLSASMRSKKWVIITASTTHQFKTTKRLKQVSSQSLIQLFWIWTRNQEACPRLQVQWRRRVNLMPSKNLRFRFTTRMRRFIPGGTHKRHRRMGCSRNCGILPRIFLVALHSLNEQSITQWANLTVHKHKAKVEPPQLMEIDTWWKWDPNNN